MDFTSFLFLFLFMPVTIIFFLVAEQRFRPPILLTASLMFYLWGRHSSLEIILLLVVVNFILGRSIENGRGTPRARITLWIGIAVNLVILILYKVWSAYSPVLTVSFVQKFLPLFVQGWLLNLVFPIGLSYITFQTISYLVDVYKGLCPGEKNFLQFCLYLLFFPKILTGPITLYRTMRNQLPTPSPDVQNVAGGLRRFAVGLAKKVLIADQLAGVVNAAFSLDTPNFSPGIAWLALIGFALQLYFDFSGYIDMALGLGQALGFQLPENFNFPYVSRSVGEFWRRWHMTLSAWFREYVFYPLERRRLPVLGQQVNILIVFLLTGLWHGITLPYLLWGFIHGLAIALESLAFGRWLRTTWRPIQHLYTLVVILFSWIFFRSSSVGFAWAFIKRLFGDVSGMTILPFPTSMPLPLIQPTFLLALILGVLFSLPISEWVARWREEVLRRQPKWALPIQILSDGFLLITLWTSVAALAAGSFAPGIYDKF